MLRVCHRNRSVFVCAARTEKKGMRKNICKPFVKLWLIFVVFFSHWRVETKKRTLLSNVWQRICNLNWWWKTTKKNSFEKKNQNHIHTITFIIYIKVKQFRSIYRVPFSIVKSNSYSYLARRNFVCVNCFLFLFSPLIWLIVVQALC